MIVIKHEFVVNVQHNVDCMLYYHQQKKEPVQSAFILAVCSSFFRNCKPLAILCDPFFVGPGRKKPTTGFVVSRLNNKTWPPI